MVENTRTTTSIDAIRALNKPRRTDVKIDCNGLPTYIRLRGDWVVICVITDKWRIDDEWWRERPITRTYYECSVLKGITVIVFQDLQNGLWYLQRI